MISIIMELSFDLGLAYFFLLSMALFPIYLGSHLSLKQKKTLESMSAEDAWKFPFVGSAVLFGLYLLFKIFSKDLINALLTSYFLFFGILATTATIRIIVFSSFLKRKSFQNWKHSLAVPFWQQEPIELSFNKVDVISFIFATLVSIWYILTKHWVANNILGLAFCIQGIAVLSLGSYKIGCILLVG
jgi:minor histocompatibility antigen H13